jgi:hypothetical protein
METTTNPVDRVLADVRKDLDAAKKARIVTLVAGAVLTVIVFAVMAVTANKVHKNVRPDTLADVAMFATRQMVKEGRPLVEQSIKTQLPVFLRSLKASLIHDVVPQLRQQVEKEMRLAIQDVFNHSSQAFQAAVKTVATRLKASGELGAKPDPEFLAAQITKEFQKEKDRRYNEAPEETLGKQFQDSRKMLVALREKLDKFVANKPKTREDALEMRFLRAWVSLLDKGDVK